jgi:hypothetical protein
MAEFFRLDGCVTALVLFAKGRVKRDHRLFDGGRIRLHGISSMRLDGVEILGIYDQLYLPY